MNVQGRHGLSVSAVVHSTKRSLADIQEVLHPLSPQAYEVTRAARWFNLGYVPISPLILFSLVKKIRSFRPDIIHLHYPNASALWLLLSQAARKVPGNTLAIRHTYSFIWLETQAYKIYQYFEKKL